MNKIKSKSRAQLLQTSNQTTGQVVETRNDANEEKASHRGSKKYEHSAGNDRNNRDELHYIKNFRPAISGLMGSKKQAKLARPFPSLSRHVNGAFVFLKGLKTAFLVCRREE